MASRKRQEPPSPMPKQFTCVEEIERGIKKLRRRREEVSALIDQRVSFTDQRVENVESAISNSVLDVFGPESPEYRKQQYFAFLTSFSMSEPEAITNERFWREGAPAAVSLLDALIAGLEESKEDFPQTPTSDVTPPSAALSRRQAIFVGHGRSLEWMRLGEFLRDRLHLDVKEYNSQEVAGLGRKERLQQLLGSCTFAFLVLTAEDQHADGTVHPRDNVIHEAGLFQGKFGFERAIVLLEDGCAEFSNIQGLGQLRFPPGRIDAVFERVRLVLEREGLGPGSKAVGFTPPGVGR